MTKIDFVFVCLTFTSYPSEIILLVSERRGEGRILGTATEKGRFPKGIFVWCSRTEHYAVDGPVPLGITPMTLMSA